MVQNFNRISREILFGFRKKVFYSVTVIDSFTSIMQ